MHIMNTLVINNLYKRCLAHASSIFPKNVWAHQPAGLRIVPLTTKYGRCTPDGFIEINRSFIGTHTENKVQQTLYHELSHLIAGLTNGHNKEFKRVFERIYPHADSKFSEQEEEVKSAVNYPYRLLGFTIGGKVLDLGGAYRRTKKYKEYTGGMSYKGDSISKFEYVKYHASIPTSE